ncbi:AI-2E family transporter [Sulfuricurvum sp.]|uniref:AI-2E family transporter n=1 Tax=Sulfuricurvum sp. TaxID=2025608 RepID=UPI002D497EAD|nr:AI-2E family transporter [Sulfuricurvum sp.]HZF70973.1 AI-2E family transporter [Sulfuricurvum sp.]
MTMKKEYFTLVLLVVVSYAMYRLYEPFWMSIIVASLLAISTHHIQMGFFKLTNSRFWASALSTLVLSALFFAPMGYFLFHFSVFLQNLDPASLEKIDVHLRSWIAHLPPALSNIEAKMELSLSKFDPASFAQNSLQYASLIGGFAMSFLSRTVFILAFYFVALYYGKEIFEFFKRSAHFPQQESTLIIFEMRSSMSVVFYSILATAVFEGALFGIAVEYMGYNGLLFGIMFGFASLIPVVGGAIMWLPFTLFELSVGNTQSAIFIALYTIVVISIIADTFIKPVIIKIINKKLIKPEDKINELIIFFAIIAGLSTFGFWGMIIGPAITVLFLTLMRISEAVPQEEMIH